MKVPRGSLLYIAWLEVLHSLAPQVSHFDPLFLDRQSAGPKCLYLRWHLLAQSLQPVQQSGLLAVYT